MVKDLSRYVGKEKILRIGNEIYVGAVRVERVKISRGYSRNRFENHYFFETTQGENIPISANGPHRVISPGLGLLKKFDF